MPARHRPESALNTIASPVCASNPAATTPSRVREIVTPSIPSRGKEILSGVAPAVFQFAASLTELTMRRFGGQHGQQPNFRMLGAGKSSEQPRQQRIVAAITARRNKHFARIA